MTEPASDQVDEYRMPILEHLRELRTRMMRCLWAMIGGLVVGFLVAQPLFEWLAKPMVDALAATGTGSLAVVEATEGFMVQMKVAGLAGFFLASPVIFWQIWGFVAPGLYDTERRWVFPLMLASTSLFLLGAAFAYFGVFHFGFPLFLQMNGPNITAVLSINSYLTFATTLLVAFGVAFQLPVVIFFLARLGLINHMDMIRGFRYSIVAIAFVAAVLTPPDIISMSLMGGPLLLLYVVGIAVARFASTKPVT
jgi:sec-independent protein translocase protein TatC